MGFYDDILILQHKEELEKIEAGREGDCIPIHVRIEPTELCNFKCDFCWWHNDENRKHLSDFRFTGKKIFDRQRLLDLIHELSDLGARALSFTGAGDPLMYPHMAQVLNSAHELGFVFGITSNMAMPMNDELVKALAKASWLRWSMNAGTIDTYLAIGNPKGRKPEGVFTRVQENIRRVNRARKDEAVPPDLNVSYVVSDINQKDIIEAARLVKALGVDSIAFRPDTPIKRREKLNFYPKHVVSEIEKARKELDTEGFHVYMNVVRQEDTQKYGDPDLICFYSNHTTHVDASGDVYPCCYTRYDSRYVIGNIMDQSFSDFWFGPERRAFYKKLYQDSCPSCGYGRFNRALKPLYSGEAKVRDILVKVDQRNYFI